MIMFWRVLSNPITGALAAGLAFILSVALFIQVARTHDWKDRAEATDKLLTTAKTGLATCHASVGNLQVGIADQNAQIEALRALGASAEAQGRKALDAAQKASRRTDVEIASALNRQPRSANKCEQADEAEAFLRGSI